MKRQDILPSLLKNLLPENLNFPNVDFKDYKVVGLGKAAPAHVKAYFEKIGLKDHLVITKKGVPPLGLNCLFGGHPNYSNDSFENGEKLIEWIKRDKRDILFMITGGASSVVEKLRPEFSKDDVINEIETLLGNTSSIHEINEYRKSISLLKGGGLKTFCEGRRIHTWIVKDVPGDDLTDVGSGPTLENDDTNYNVLCTFEDLQHSVTNLGLEFIAPALNTTLENGLKTLLKRGTSISGGELTVKVTGEGKGGRNSHFVLSAAIDIFERNVLDLSEEEKAKVYIASLATDGDDGNSGAAGGFMDYPSWKVAISLGLEPSKFIQDNDSAGFLERLGCLYLTGITGTNVMDIRLISIPE